MFDMNLVPLLFTHDHYIIQLLCHDLSVRTPFILLIMLISLIPTTPKSLKQASLLIGLAKNKLKVDFVQSQSIPKARVDKVWFEIDRENTNPDINISQETFRSASIDVSDFVKGLKVVFQKIIVMIAQVYLLRTPFPAWKATWLKEYNNREAPDFHPGEHALLFHFLSDLRVQMGIFFDLWDFCDLGSWFWQSQSNARVLGLLLLKIVSLACHYVANRGSDKWLRPNDIGVELNERMKVHQSSRNWVARQWIAPPRSHHYRSNMPNSSNAQRAHKLTVQDVELALLAATIQDMKMPKEIERVS